MQQYLGFLPVVAIGFLLSACQDSVQDSSVAQELVQESSAQAQDQKKISLQSQFSPLFLVDAPKGGGHPIGGPAFNFVETANSLLLPLDAHIGFHVTGEVARWDVERVEPPLVKLPGDFADLYQAVAANPEAGGIDMAVVISNTNGFEFGTLLVAGLPFGLEPDEFISYLYDGGGLELQQTIYDEKFDQNLVVLPVGMTPTQGGGWFSQTLPEPGPDLSPEEAMATLCKRPIIVRWPAPGSNVWQKACANVGVETGSIGAQARCADVNAQCPGDDNPVVNDVQSLTFGGFVFGGLPHALVLKDQIDAYELNTAYSDVLMMKLATDQADIENDGADISNVIAKAPYLYGSTWHQPHSYIELIVNREFWESLSGPQRTAIRIAAQASVTQSLSLMLDVQDDGIAILEKNGAQLKDWPEGLLDLLRVASDEYLDEEAARLAANGDDSYKRVLQSQRDYIAGHQKYNDFGDVNQGRSRGVE